MKTRWTWTPGPWRFKPMETIAEYERLTGKIKPEHEKYCRDNNGDWIISFEGGRVATASFRGTAKRGQAYNAPDSEGMANAKLIAKAPEMAQVLLEMYHAPDMYHADELFTRAELILREAGAL